MRVGTGFALLLLLPSWAGCLDSGSPPGYPQDEPGSGTAQRRDEARTLYFDDRGRLLATPASRGAVALSWSHPQWVLGDPPAVWTADAGPGWGVLEATAHLTFRARDAAASTAVRDEFTVWWGSLDSVVAHAVAAGAALYAPGDEATFAMPLEIPRNGLWLSPDEAMAARVATYTTDGPGLDRFELVVGGPRGSRIEFRAVVHAGEPAASNRTASWNGTHGGDCAGGANQFLEHAASLRDVREVRLTATGAGVQDLDVYVLHADGFVMRAHGPGTTEVLRLREPNVAGLGADDEVALQVVGVCAGRLDYELVALA